VLTVSLGRFGFPGGSVYLLSPRFPTTHGFLLFMVSLMSLDSVFLHVYSVLASLYKFTVFLACHVGFVRAKINDIVNNLIAVSAVEVAVT